MAKKKNSKRNRILPAEQEAAKAASTSGGVYAVRETIESIVIAFVLAFLFRTFEAEAFVIPTGSMSPSLQGQHKDVCCSECGYRFRTSASSEGEDRMRLIAQSQDPKSLDVVVGMCPICRQTMAMRPDLPPRVPAYINQDGIEAQTSYPGDRILVNKYCYNSRDPERWDVVVFKFPGDGEMNYIKRLVGLPNETLRIYQGDLFIRDDQKGGGFRIERKPAGKVQAMLQPVHDTNYDPGTLHDAGWPLRWEATTSAGWEVNAQTEQQTVKQSYRAELPADQENASLAWLRYRHYVPQSQDWVVAREFKENGKHLNIDKQQWLQKIKPELIRDFNPYNATRLRGIGDSRQRGILDVGWDMPEKNYGMHWVSDLAVECDIEIEKAEGELHLDLVEAGKHFVCQIDLATGQATIGIEGSDDFSTTAQTSVNSSGSYHLRFANVDDQLLLWIDGEEVQLSEFEVGLPYDGERVFGGRKNAIPQTSETDLGDLAPVGIGARGATLTVNRLKVLRDIYYVSTHWSRPQIQQVSDYPHPRSVLQLDDGKQLPSLESVRQQFTDPESWGPRFSRRRIEDFSIKAGQLFVMGDNSPASSDCRLWASGDRRGSKPGGPYLDRRLLIGKAVCVFWPHSWGGIPGADVLPGFPNFGDMRIVR